MSRCQVWGTAKPEERNPQGEPEQPIEDDEVKPYSEPDGEDTPWCGACNVSTV